MDCGSPYDVKCYKCRTFIGRAILQEVSDDLPTIVCPKCIELKKLEDKLTRIQSLWEEK